MARKKLNVMAGFVVAMAFTLSISVNANATPRHKTTAKRTEYAVAIDMSVKDGLTYIKTGDGNMWAFKSKCSANVGNIYKVTFNTMGTTKRKDDRIVSVRYIGYISNVKNA